MSENCHCGRPVVGESEATPGPAARHLCETCLPVRCDAYPGACKTFSCGRCGDDSEPADCPDRMSFDDHGLCCIGTCAACQHRIDQGETE